MKTVSILAYNRQAYLKRVLEALAVCRGIRNYHVVVSLDNAPYEQPTWEVAQWFKEKFTHYRVWKNMDRQGVDLHPKLVYGELFSGPLQSTFNVVFEDDIVPSPDALELCDWFYHLPDRDQYACLLLHGATKDQSHSLQVNEFMRFCPWGWAFTRSAWEDIFRPEWNAKPPTPSGGTGWDWSCGLTIQRHALKCLVPVLSRTLNIGREGGVYESPDHWDAWAKDLVASDGTHGKDYFIGDRLRPGYENDVDPWVTEAKRMEAPAHLGKDVHMAEDRAEAIRRPYE